MPVNATQKEILQVCAFLHQNPASVQSHKYNIWVQNADFNSNIETFIAGLRSFRFSLSNLKQIHHLFGFCYPQTCLVSAYPQHPCKRKMG